MYSHLSELVTTALSQSQLSGISEMLRSIATAVNAYGSILWQAAPGSQVETRQGNLQVLAEWFPDGRSSALYNLPLDGSATGEALWVRHPRAVENVKAPQVYEDPFFTEAGICTFCALPIRFSDETWGALNLYRNFPQPFTPSELELGESLAALIPDLYQAIRDRVSFNLIHEVHEILHEAEISAHAHPLGIEEMKQVISRICNLISDSFQCIETSVFLEDRLKAPGTYGLAATTWAGPFPKRTYYRNPEDGLTGWVLAHAKAVKIPNLSRFEQDQPTIQHEYPGVRWNDPLHLEASVRNFLPSFAREWLPLSFMAVPILRGDHVHGAIRCSVAKRSPYYFARHEENLLMLVAAQIGRSWSGWLSRREMDEENRTWKTVVESIRELNSFVLSELSKNEPNESRIFGESLRVTSSIIAGAEIMDVRLLDEKNQELYFAETHGDAWHKGEPQVLQQRRQRRFPLNDPTQPSAGAHVVETGEVYVIPDVSRDGHYSETFPKTKRMIVAPMVSVPDEPRLNPKVLGVLDIRGTELRDFPRHAKDIAGLLGSQLGLYHDLATTIGRLQRLQQEQIQTFQDLKHQFKTPIVQAHRRIGLVLKSPTLDEKLRDRLLKVRGLIAKAMRVSMSTGLFANLAKGEPLVPNLSTLTPDDLIKLLIEAGADNRLMVEAGRHIDFKIEKAGFDRLSELTVDRELLEQAVYDLLDNAFKYSFNDSIIRIFGGVTGTGRFHISIVNKGIPIAPHEVTSCIKRGWQSEVAKSASGSGSGIGLWIVDHIMKAHGGELQISATRANDETEIKLLFPKTSYW